MKKIVLASSSLILGLLIASAPLAVLAHESHSDEDTSSTPSFEVCTDGIDNDEDGFADALDSDCAPYYRILSVVNHIVGTTTSPAQFSFTVNGVDVSDLGTFTFNAGGENNFLNTLVGEYSVTEAPVTGYTVSYDNCGSGTAGDNALTLPINGVEETCTITNTWIVATTTPPTDGTTTPPTDGTTTPPVTSSGDTGGGSSGGSGHHIRGGSSGGEVLGASTCGPLLTSYLREGRANDPEQVKALQDFLNKELGLTLDVSGIFGHDTEQAVEAFQIKYWEDALLPWVKWGLPTHHTPTGYVYKTTLHKINKLSCAALDVPVPELP